MTVFVLIHGAWHGGRCWDKLKPLLHAKGHTVLAPDLAGMGSDTRKVPQDTLRIWADDVAELVRNQVEPVVLVGHSRGGIVISEVAERVPDRIRQLVYLTAYLVPPGSTLAEMRSLVPSGLRRDQLLLSTDGLYTMVAPDAARDLFYHLAPEGMAAYTEHPLSPEPIAAARCALQLSEERYGSVPRAYIEALRDQMIEIALQRQMQALQPCGQVVTLDSDHSPFYSMPGELAEVLDGLARNPTVGSRQ